MIYLFFFLLEYKLQICRFLSFEEASVWAIVGKENID